MWHPIRKLSQSLVCGGNFGFRSRLRRSFVQQPRVYTVLRWLPFQPFQPSNTNFLAKALGIVNNKLLAPSYFTTSLNHISTPETINKQQIRKSYSARSSCTKASAVYHNASLYINNSFSNPAPDATITMSAPPATPRSQMFTSVPTTPATPTGTWRHPAMEALSQRRSRETFTDASLAKVTWNGFALVMSFILVAFGGTT